MSCYLSLAIVLPDIRVRDDVLQVELFDFVHDPFDE